jgi:hypothetical protein
MPLRSAEPIPPCAFDHREMEEPWSAPVRDSTFLGIEHGQIAYEWIGTHLLQMASPMTSPKSYYLPNDLFLLCA